MKPKSPGLQKYWQSLLLVMLPACLLVALYYLLLQGQTNTDATQRYAQGVADLQADAIDFSLEQLSAQLDGISRLPELRRVLAEGDQKELDKLAAQWTMLFSQVDRLDLLPLGELGVAGLEEAQKTRLRNNIEKDMLHRAVNSESAIVDVYRLDGRYVLSLTKAVVAGNRKVGALLLTLQSAWLSQALDNLGSEVLPGGETTMLYDAGTASLDRIVGADNASASSVSAQTQLKLLPAVTLRHSVVDTVDVGATSALLLVAGIGLVLITGLLALSRLRKQMAAAFEDEASQLKRYVGEAFENRPARPELGFESLANVLQGFDAALAKFREKVEANPGNGAGATRQQESKAPKANADDWKNPALSTMGVEEETTEASTALPAHIFRAYDIRGVADEDLRADAARQIGQAIGSAAQEAGDETVLLGRDGRLSSERLAEALTEGLLASGCDVVDIGLVPTPVLYFAVEHLQSGSGVMVTGSHNGPQYNGFKVVVNGQALVDEQVTALYERIQSGSLREGEGSLSRQDLVDSYIDQIVDDVVFASPIKVVLDCGNGAAGEIAPMLFASMGAEVVPLFADIDGNFPNHLPDPGVAENLQALIREVADQQADIGLAFDGDADRVVAVTGAGQIVEADSLIMLFARDVLTRNPGADVVYDQKCSRNLSHLIANYGGRPVMWKSGHSRVKQKMLETGALLGGEYSGHFFFKERWFGFDDGLYSGARLIEMLTLEGVSLQEAIEQLPSSVSSPELSIPVDEQAKFEIIALLQQSSQFDEGEKSTLDGLRVDFAEGWGLVRASNTGPRLTARFEAESEEELARIRALFEQALAEFGVAVPGA